MFETSQSDRPLDASAAWIANLLTGQMAITLCTIAVALVGFSMLTGRLDLRRGAAVVGGCFLLLGAPLIAASLMDLGTSGPEPQRPVLVYEAGPREPLPPAR